MPAAHGYNDSPTFWNAYLASSVANYLTEQEPREQLVADYHLYLDSPAGDGLKNLLPTVPKQPKKGRA
jgi:hypothetical protein